MLQNKYGMYKIGMMIEEYEGELSFVVRSVSSGALIVRQPLKDVVKMIKEELKERKDAKTKNSSKN